MKRGYIWAGVYGAIVVVVNLINAATLLSNPSDLPLVDIAAIVSYLCMAGLGTLLVAIYFTTKKKEDEGGLLEKITPNSPEELVHLEKTRNRVLAFVILYEVAGSIGTWILNDYAAGFTLINIDIVFDLFINIIFVYVAIQLFRNKKVLNQVLITVLAMVVIEGTLAFLRAGWLPLLSVLFIAPYFFFATKVPLNRMTFRVIHLVVLPTTLLVSAILGYLINAPLNKLLKNDQEIFQQYATQNFVTSQAYEIFLQKNYPTATDIQNVRDAIEKGNQINANISINAEKATAEFEKQLPGIVQQKQLYHLKNYQSFLMLNKSQAQKMLDFMNFAKTIDFAHISTKEANDLNFYKNEVDNFNSQIQAVAFKLGNDLK